MRRRYFRQAASCASAFIISGILFSGAAAASASGTSASDAETVSWTENLLSEEEPAEPAGDGTAYAGSEEEMSAKNGASGDAAVSSAAEETAGTPASHVRGMRNFSIIEGMHPDVMSGVTWDETIRDVLADTTEVVFDEPGVYTLVYSVFGNNGEREDVPITVTVYADLDHYLYGMEGEVEIETGSDFDPMEHVVFDDPIASVEPDLSALDTSRQGEYLISYVLTATDGRQQTTVRRVNVTDEIERPEGFEGTTEAYSTVTDLGLWRLTAYMDTPEDQGPYVGMTASGAPLVAGRTVAVSSATCARLGLMFGDRLMIDGHVYVLEDHGGYAMYDQNWVDIYVDNPADEYSDLYNRYAEVYLLR